MPVTPQTPLSRPEFIALMAMLTATVAFSIDAMLPALPEIGEALTAEAPNRAQLIITSFVLGLGLGTFIVGPLSDAFGRKPVILAGAGLYCAGSALAYVAPTLELLLAARALQGLGAAAPRIVTLAIVRDASRGREMARMMSFVMLIFLLAAGGGALRFRGAHAADAPSGDLLYLEGEAIHGDVSPALGTRPSWL